MTILLSTISASNVLSAKELFSISQEISKKFAPVVSVKSSVFAKSITLTTKELQEISEEITRKYPPKITYATPKLVLLPIDPEHLFVAWNLSRAQMTTASKDTSGDIVLRVYPKANESAGSATRWFDVDLDQAKSRQKVTVPEGHQASEYRAIIGVRDHGSKLIPLATSEAIQASHVNIVSTTPCGDKKTLATNLSQASSSNQDRLQNNNKNKMASSQAVK